jgi:hypothetical protein
MHKSMICNHSNPESNPRSFDLGVWFRVWVLKLALFTILTYFLTIERPIELKHIVDQTTGYARSNRMDRG